MGTKSSNYSHNINGTLPSYGPHWQLAIWLNCMGYKEIRIKNSLAQMKLFMQNKNRRLYVILLAVPLLLLIPFIGMQFSSEVNWSSLDFLIMGMLLLVLGIIFEVVWRKVSSKVNRISLTVFILILCLLIWAELAVGIFGTPFAGS